MARLIVGVLSVVLIAACGDATGPDATGPTASQNSPGDGMGDRSSKGKGSKGNDPKYESVRDAVAAIEKRVDLAIRVPDDLDNATVVDVRFGDFERGGGASLVLELSDGSTVSLDYGGAALWGCGDAPASPDRVVRVGTHPGVLRNFGSGRWSLHWPASRRRTTGFYGITAEGPPDRLLRWARAMGPVGNRAVPQQGC